MSTITPFLNRRQSHKKTINIFEYSDGLLFKRFYQSGMSEEQALEEYYRHESAYQLTEISNSRSEILASEISEVNKPNLLWKIQANRGEVVYLTTSRDRHLIAVSWQDNEPPFVGEKKLVEIFSSMKFISQQEAENLLRSWFDSK